MNTVKVKIVKILGYADGVVKLLGESVNDGVSIKFSCVPLTTISIGDVLTTPNPMEKGAVLTNELTDTPVATYTLDLVQLDRMSRSVEGFNWEVETLAKERENAEKHIVSLVMVEPIQEPPYLEYLGIRRGEAIVFSGGDATQPKIMEPN